MLLYYFLNFIDNLKLAFANWIPLFGTPGFWTTYVPQIIDKIMSFNDYLPIIETFITVVFCLTCTLVWKIAKIVLGIVQVNLGA